MSEPCQIKANSWRAFEFIKPLKSFLILILCLDTLINYFVLNTLLIKGKNIWAAMWQPMLLQQFRQYGSFRGSASTPPQWQQLLQQKLSIWLLWVWGPLDVLLCHKYPRVTWIVSETYCKHFLTFWNVSETSNYKKESWSLWDQVSPPYQPLLQLPETDNLHAKV